MADPIRYYDFGLYRNTRYAINMAVETYLANVLFGGDGTRIVYSSTQYAFRERSSSLTPNLNNLEFPFLNYRMDKVDKVDPAQTARSQWKHVTNSSGAYFPELSRKLRFTPMEIAYDSTIFYHRDDELQYGFDELIWEDSNDTTLYPVIEIDGEEIVFPAYFEYHLDYNPEYNETTALDSNRISSATLNFRVESLIIKDNFAGGNYCIPEKIVFDFLVMHGFDPDEIQSQETYEYIIDHFNEEVTLSS